MTESLTIAKGYCRAGEFRIIRIWSQFSGGGHFFGTSDDHFDGPAAQMGGVAKKKKVIDEDRTGFDSLTMRANYQGDS